MLVVGLVTDQNDGVKVRFLGLLCQHLFLSLI